MTPAEAAGNLPPLTAGQVAKIAALLTLPVSKTSPKPEPDPVALATEMRTALAGLEQVVAAAEQNRTVT